VLLEGVPVVAVLCAAHVLVARGALFKIAIIRIINGSAVCDRRLAFTHRQDRADIGREKR